MMGKDQKSAMEWRKRRKKYEKMGSSPWGVWCDVWSKMESHKEDREDLAIDRCTLWYPGAYIGCVSKEDQHIGYNGKGPEVCDEAAKK